LACAALVFYNSSLVCSRKLKYYATAAPICESSAPSYDFDWKLYIGTEHSIQQYN